MINQLIKKIDCSLRLLLSFLLGLYQKLLSPDHSFWAKFIIPHGYCQFYPTCSMYAKDALSIYSLPQSLKLIVSRLLRCHPWSQGGLDYLPTHKQN